MRIYWDLSTNRLLESPGINRGVPVLEWKRGDAAELELQFVRGAQVVTLPAGAEIRFALKPVGQYDADPVVYSAAYQATTPTTNIEAIAINRALDCIL